MGILILYFFAAADPAQPDKNLCFGSRPISRIGVEEGDEDLIFESITRHRS